MSGIGNEEFATEIEVPAEELEDTNFQPRPEAPKNGTEGHRAAPRSDLPGRDELERQIKRLTRTSEDNKKRADQAQDALVATQRRAVEDVGRMRQETLQTRKQSVETSRAAIEAVISETEAGLNAAKQQFKQAYDAGDGEALANAQLRISELTVARVENMRRRDALPTAEQVAAEATAPIKDPSKMTPSERFEAYLSQFQPKAQDWLRKHPEFASDAKLNRKLSRAHEEATLDRDLEENSPEYFDFINQKLGLEEGDNDDGYFEDDPQPEPQPRRQPQREDRDVQRSRGSVEGRGSDGGARQFTDNRNNRPMRSAPVRGGSDTGTVRGSRVRVGLTEGEISAATDGTTHVWNYDDPSGQDRFKKGDAIGVTEMARRKALMKKAGRYNMPSE